MRFQTSIFALASSFALSLASPAPEPQSNKYRPQIFSMVSTNLPKPNIGCDWRNRFLRNRCSHRTMGRGLRISRSEEPVFGCLCGAFISFKYLFLSNKLESGDTIAKAKHPDLASLAPPFSSLPLVQMAHPQLTCVFAQSNFGASLASQWTAGYVADTSAIAAFPTEAQVYLKSIIPAQLSILTKNGYVITNTRGATPGPTPPAGGAQPSVTSKGEAVPTMAVKAGAGMAVGFVAAVLAL